MKSLSLIFFFLISLSLLAQEKVLEISRTGSETSRIFKENKRVKLKTISGEKHIGRFQILNAEDIEIEGNIIPLSTIKNIKSRSVVAGIVGTILIISGPYFLGISPMTALVYGSTTGFIFAAGGVVMTLTGIFFNEFTPNQRNTKWAYKIIEQ